MKRLTISILLLTVLASGSALAAEVSGKSRTFTYSCGYFSSQVSDVEISYHNPDLEWGVIVQMIYGYEGVDVRGGGDDVRRVRIEWQRESRDVVVASAPYTWTAKMQVPVHYRSSSTFYDTLNFVYRLIHPDGRIEFDNGTDAPWGFYKLKLAGNGGCYDQTNPLPEFQPAEITTTARY